MAEPGRDLDEDRVDACVAGPTEVAPSRRPPAPVRVPTLAERLLDGCATGILAGDERGVVRSANPAALALLPGLRVGELLVGLPDRGGPGPQVEEITVGGRQLAVRCEPLPDGWTSWYVHDVTTEQARVDNLLAERSRARFLAGASRRLGLSLHPRRTARTIVELAAAELADAVAVVWSTSDGDGQVEWVSGVREGSVDGGRARAATLPQPVLEALRGLETDPRPVLLDDLADMPWTGMPWTEAPDGPAADVDVAERAVWTAGVVALPGNGVPAGALVLLRREVGARAVAAAGDGALVEEFAQRAGIALAAAALYGRQVRTAEVLRSSLVQPPLPEVPGMSFGAVYRPSDEGLLIGGDFYDVLPRPGRSTTFLLGDVCGKGVDAAVGTGQLRQSVLALRRLEDDPVRLLDLLNATMLETMPADCAPRFATLVLGSATPRADGGVRLQLAGGGHLPPLLVRSDGGVEPVDIGGMLVGAVENARFRCRTVDLAPGESCVLYSDGVTEAHGGVDGRQDFGEERLTGLLRGCDVLPAPGIAERVALHAIRWLTDGHHDDIAVLVVQAPLPVRPPAGRHLHSVSPPPLESDPVFPPPTRVREETP